MKKMTKALAVLTVLAMLATLFVAVPASATLADDISGLTPTITVIFTSDDAMETPVDIATLNVDDVFYAWPQIGGLPADAFIVNGGACLTWNAAVVAPADEDGAALDDPADFTAGAQISSPDFDTESLQYKKTKKTGAYQCDGDNGIFYFEGESGVEASNFYGYEFLPGNNGDLKNNKAGANNVFQSPTDEGTFTVYGFRFVKIADGNIGVTIPWPNKTLNGNAVATAPSVYGAYAAIGLSDMNNTSQQAQGATLVGYTTPQFTDNSPKDGAAEPTAEPTEEPTEEPTLAPVAGEKQASKSDKSYNQNAFFYEFVTPAIPGDVKGLTATFQIPGKDAVAGSVTNINLAGIKSVGLKIAAVIKNIPVGQEDTPVTTTYTLTYIDEVTGATKTLEWSRTNSLN